MSITDTDQGEKDLYNSLGTILFKLFTSNRNLERFLFLQKSAFNLLKDTVLFPGVFFSFLITSEMKIIKNFQTLPKLKDN